MKLPDSQKNRDRSCYAEHNCILSLPDNGTDFSHWQDRNLVNANLRSLVNSILHRRFNCYADLIRIRLKAGGQKTNDDRRQFREKITLNDQCGPWLAVVARQGNRDELTPSHQISDQSVAVSSKRIISSPPGSLIITESDCLLQIAANALERVSGTHIWTGRIPAARIR